jgi:hypothetical protein
MKERKYDQNYYFDNQKRLQDRQREYYQHMPPEMKEAYRIENRRRNAEWYRKKHPNAKPYEPRPEQRRIKPKPPPTPTPREISYTVRNETKLIYLRWD